MDSQADLFRRRAFKVFKTEDISEPLLMSYQQLAIALRDNTDTLILSKTELIQVANSVPVKRLSMIYGDTSIYAIFKRNMLLIFEHDDLVKQYFLLHSTEKDELIIDVIKPRS